MWRGIERALRGLIASHRQKIRLMAGLHHDLNEWINENTTTQRYKEGRRQRDVSLKLF